MVTQTKLILDKLDNIKEELDYIKERMTDKILTNEDIIALEEAEKDLEEGKTKRL